MHRTIKKQAAFSGVLLSLVFATPTVAIDTCIEAPRRSKPCPHLIYKLMKLKDDQPAQITCICLTDFKKFLTPATDDTAIALRKMELKMLTAELQLSEAQILSLAKR